MSERIQTVVTFTSSLFNTSTQKAYFINPGCFGEDVAKWLADQLRNKGYEAANLPGQEDFGWYFTFQVSGIEYCFVISYRPADKNEEGVWIGWLERSRGLVASILGGRKRGIDPQAAQAIHEALSSSPQIGNIRWHFEHDFKAAHEELGTSEPASRQ